MPIINDRSHELVDYVKVAARSGVSPVVLRDSKVEMSKLGEFLGEELYLSVSGYVLGGCRRDVTARVSLPVPSSWWQHVKLDLLSPLTRNPSTFVGRWLESATVPHYTIASESYTDSVYANICPHGAISAPDAHLGFLVERNQLLRRPS